MRIMAVCSVELACSAASLNCYREKEEGLVKNELLRSQLF